MKRTTVTTIAFCTLLGCVKSTPTTEEAQPAGRPPAATGDNGPHGTNIHGGNSGSPPPQTSVKPRNQGGATCVTGLVETASNSPIPVASAHVVFSRDGVQVGDAMTDEGGRFAWCAPKAVEAVGTRLTMQVDKASFARMEQPLELVSGTTKQLTIDMFLRE